MPYFEDNYSTLSYPMAAGDTPGLYNAQIGAIHALASHFTIDSRPAIVTMPTGSGKTAVLMMVPFVSKARRVLVITPSQFVRWQIASDFAKLTTLKSAGVLPADLPVPTLKELKTRVSSLEDWEALRQFDVVVSTPNCASPGYEQVPEPPTDIFDLVLIDEAHHSSAKTWNHLINAFPSIRRVLFTATPFRRDRGEIPGRFVYTYPVARAYHDGIFGRIRYVPVEPQLNLASNDVAIARRTEEILAADRAAGLDHYVMVRTDRRSRADDLAQIYSDNTNLRVAVVHSSLSNTRVRSTLDALGRGEIDALICVSMLGEGFNFPKLKIAAIHAPHRSLEVTLQFIGRFARTNAMDIGEAKFIGITNDMQVEGRRLFEEGAVWQDIVPDLAHGRVEQERRIRERLEQFHDADEADVDLQDLSLYSLYPRSHVKIYDVPDPVDLRAAFDFDTELDVRYRNVNDDGSVLILITRDRTRPKWSATDTMLNSEYDLIVVFSDTAHNLLFINASRSAEGLYETISRTLHGRASTLPTNLIRRVVRGINNQRIFNIGMRNIQAVNTAESYRIIAGPDTQGVIRPIDSRLYRQGHAFLTGDTAQGKVTIGYSSGSKVWAALSNQIPGLVDWCTELGEKIRTAGDVVTNSGLDYLSAGDVIDYIPDDIIHVQWNREVFEFDPPVTVEYQRDDGVVTRAHILDLELSLDRANTNRDRATVIVSGDGIRYAIVFSISDDDAGAEFYQVRAGTEGRVRVAQGQTSVTLVQYLNAYYLSFFTAGGALLSGNELFTPSEPVAPISDQQLEAWDWTGTNIRAEVTGGAGGISVHERVRQELERSTAEAILYDHGTGEIADFVTFERRDGTFMITLYHCKGSAEANPGARVEDIYEVCGQAQKSVALASVTRLQARLFERRQRTQIVRGTVQTIQDLLQQARNMRTRFEIVVVQPGIRRAQLTQGMKEPMGATDEHLRSAACAPLRLIVS